jgi:hypothetical protein
MEKDISLGKLLGIVALGLIGGTILAIVDIVTGKEGTYPTPDESIVLRRDRV